MGNEFANDMLWLNTFGLVDLNKQEKQAKAAKDAANRDAGNQDTGALSDEEAMVSSSKKAFRRNLFYTSPTGTDVGGSRGRSRLMGM